MEPIERHGHEHGPKAIDGRERAEQHAGTVLDLARLHHHEMEHRLDDQSQHAAHDEDPEDVEEVQGDVALPRLVAAERAILHLFARLQVAQQALQFALLGKRRVDVARKGNEQHHDNGEKDKVGVDAEQHHVAEDARHGQCDERLGRLGRVPPLVAQKADAEDDEQHRQQDQHPHHHERDDGGRHGLVFECTFTEHADDDEHDERHHGCGRNAAQQAQNAEQLHQDRQLLPVDGRLVTLQNRCFVVRLGRFGTLVAHSDLLFSAP